MNKIYLVISGKGGSGKTTFCDFCKKYERCAEISIVDYVKTIATIAGWKKEKTFLARKFLADLKDALEAYDDIPFKKTIISARSCHENIIFINARENRDRQRFKDYFGNSCFTILVKRDDLKNVTYGNRADDGTERGDFDFIVENSGSLEDLEREAERIILKVKELTK